MVKSIENNTNYHNHIAMSNYSWGLWFSFATLGNYFATGHGVKYLYYDENIAPDVKFSCGKAQLYFTV